MRFRKIGADHKSLLAESTEDFLRDICFRIRAEGTCRIGNPVIGLLRVEHAKAVVMFGGKHDISHPGISCCLRPFYGIELCRIKCLLEIFVLPLVLDVIGIFPPAPVFILGADGPRFDDTPLTVRTPVHQQTELCILPFLQLLKNKRIRFRIIFLEILLAE